MTLLYVLLGALVLWIAYVALAKPRKARPHTPQEPYKIPVKIGARDDNVGHRGGTQEPIEKDAWEGSFWEVTQPLPAKARLRLKYTDGTGGELAPEKRTPC